MRVGISGCNPPPGRPKGTDRRKDARRRGKIYDCDDYANELVVIHHS